MIGSLTDRKMEKKRKGGAENISLSYRRNETVAGSRRSASVPNRAPRTETVQYKYMYRYTPSIPTIFSLLGISTSM